MKKRGQPLSIGLFGGSFNPVHIGHVLLARWARAALKLDEVWFLPCALSADGKRLAPAMQRVIELEKALKGESGLKLNTLDLELGGVSRAVNTLWALQERYGKQRRFTWLLGQDQALRLPRWKHSDELPSLSRFAVFERPGSPPIPKSVHRRFRLKTIVVPSIEISSSRIKQEKQALTGMDLGVF